MLFCFFYAVNWREAFFRRNLESWIFWKLRLADGPKEHRGTYFDPYKASPLSQKRFFVRKILSQLIFPSDPLAIVSHAQCDFLFFVLLPAYFSVPNLDAYEYEVNEEAKSDLPER